MIDSLDIVRRANVRMRDEELLIEHVVTADFKVDVPIILGFSIVIYE